MTEPTPTELRARLDALEHIDDRVLASQAADAMTPEGSDHRWLLDIAVSLVDLTSLEATDTPERVRRLAQQALAPAGPDGGAPRVAAVCVWPDLVGVAAEVLAGSEVKAAAVAGAFPHARSPLAVRVAEVEAAVAAGADEIDLVIDRAALRDDREHEALTQLVELRRACGDATCKVILETGALGDADAVHRAAWVAMLAGADMLKTSTGKDGPGASPGAVGTLLHAAKVYERESGRAVGVKIAGGIRTPTVAISYLRLVRQAAGSEWLRPERLRLGASSLLDQLVSARDDQPG
jgi:deoxyribose-phosphate aldolase